MATLRWWRESWYRCCMSSPLLVCRDSIQSPCRSRSLGADRPCKALRRPRGVAAIYRLWPRRSGVLTRGSACSGRFALICLVFHTVLGLSPRVDAAQSASPPAPDAAMHIFNQARQALDDWSAEGLETEAVAASAVTLRSAAGVAGRGVCVEGGADCVGRALREAMAEAERRLLRERDALRDERRSELGSHLALELELSGPWTPHEPASLDEASLEISPGVEGVGVRLGGDRSARFPLFMLEAAMGPAGAYRSLLAEVGGDATLALRPLEELRAEGLALYRFEVRHLAQLRPEGPPEFLHRGAVVVERRELNAGSLRRWASALTGHLLGRLEPTRAGASLRGVLHPSAANEGEPAGAATRGLVAFALSEAAGSGLLDESTAGEARRGAGLLLEELAALHRETAVAERPAVAALAWMAASRLDGLEEEALGGLLSSARGTLDVAAQAAGAVDEAERAVVAQALAERARAGEVQPAAAEAFLRGIYERTPADRLVTHAPWLAWAELRLAGEDDRVAAGVALRQLRDLVWAHQLSAQDTGYAGRDLEGGIVFTASATPLPTWQSARAVAMLATMLGDARLTPAEERGREIVRVLGSLRFLRQLTVDEWSGRLHERRAQAAGGVRAALWDQRLPAEASAMSLLAVVEFLKSLERMR